MRTTVIFGFALALGCAGLDAQGAEAAQTYDDVLFRTLEWRNLGPNRGGRSLGCCGSPGRKLEYYFGATGGGLWKTTDGGTTWAPVTDGKLTSSSVGAVAVAETDPDVVYIGMGAGSAPERRRRRRNSGAHSRRD